MFSNLCVCFLLLQSNIWKFQPARTKFSERERKNTPKQHNIRQPQLNKEHTHLFWSYILVHFSLILYLFKHICAFKWNILILQLYYVWLMNARVNHLNWRFFHFFFFFFLFCRNHNSCWSSRINTHIRKHCDIFSKIKYYVVGYYCYCYCCRCLFVSVAFFLSMRWWWFRRGKIKHAQKWEVLYEISMSFLLLPLLRMLMWIYALMSIFSLHIR